MNVIFHLAALAAALGLAWGLLRVQKQRDLLRRLAAGVHKVEVAPPVEYLAAFAAALGITFEVTGTYSMAPRRVRGWVLFEMLTGRSVTLIRCVKPASADTGAELLVEITTGRALSERAAAEAAAAEALGERVQVSIISNKGTP